MNRIRIPGVLAAALIVLSAVTPAPAKQSPPPPGPLKKLAFPAYSEMTMKNGLEVVVVENHEQPIANIWLAVKAGSVLDPEGKSSLASYTSALVNKGTKDKDAKKLAEWIESVGGSFDATTNEDETIFTISVLSEHLDTAYQYLADVILNPTFPQDEFQEEQKRSKTNIEFEKSDPRAMADRHFAEVVYGHHPYAISPTTESVEAVTRDDVAAFHKKNYVANNALLFVVGDVKKGDVKKDVEKYLGAWQGGTPDVANYTAPPERTARNISLYHRPGSVQTNIEIGELGLRPTDPDWPAVAVGNRILGGGASGRLFMELREKHGWTYGVYSSFSKEKDRGLFTAGGSCRTEVTDSTVSALLDNIQRITTEPVTDAELEGAKSYIVGNFPTTIETPAQVAAQIGQVKLLGLDKTYLENYRKEVAKVTKEDVLAAMQKHLHPDHMAIVLVGDATAIKDKMEAVAPVATYDIDGNPMSMDEMSVEGTDFEYDTTPLKNSTATYAVKYQEMNLGDMNVTLEKKGDDFASSTAIAGMLQLNEDMSFGSKFEPKSYTFSMTAGPQQASAQVTFDGGVAKGQAKGGKDGDKDINVTLVKGAILKESLDVVISTLPLEAGKSYKFPVIDAQSGTLENVTVDVAGEEDVTVPAGTYKTYRLTVKSGEGDQTMYVRKDLPHVLVKQSLPAQGLNIELKALKI
ncbi:MAG TPA: insulinase family protein [Candidatus Krumholzibacteria bacterium]|nr:insulinase family protein [Candidatus Krumholzibacteria bacterium]